MGKVFPVVPELSDGFPGGRRVVFEICNFSQRLSSETNTTERTNERDRHSRERGPADEPDDEWKGDAR